MFLENHSTYDSPSTSAEPQSGLRYSWFGAVLTLLGSLVVLFIAAPLVSMALATSWGQLGQAAAEREVRDSIALTLLCSLAATMAAVLAGVPLAYLLARRRFPGRSVLLAVIDLPILIPHSAAGIALLGVIGRDSLAATLFGGSFVGTWVGISLAMAFVSLPFLVNAAHEAFAAVPGRLEKVARTLGAPPSRVFLTISLPLAWRGILSGVILMWARGISEFGAVIIIAYHPMVAPVLVYQRFLDLGLGTARTISVLLVGLCVVILMTLRLLSRRRGRDRLGA